MADNKTEVLTTRVDESTREWIEYLAGRYLITPASAIRMVLEEKVASLQCCEKGPNKCDHVWCSTCREWAKDTGGMDPDTEEAHWNCGHPAGISRTSGRAMKQPDPFAPAPTMKINGGLS